MDAPPVHVIRCLQRLLHHNHLCSACSMQCWDAHVCVRQLKPSALASRNVCNMIQCSAIWYVCVRTVGKQTAHVSVPEVGAVEPHNAAGLCCREEVKLCRESGLISEALPPHLRIVVCCEVNPPREACTCSRHTLWHLLIKTYSTSRLQS